MFPKAEGEGEGGGGVQGKRAGGMLAGMRVEVLYNPIFDTFTI